MVKILVLLSLFMVGCSDTKVDKKSSETEKVTEHTFTTSETTEETSAEIVSNARCNTVISRQFKNEPDTVLLEGKIVETIYDGDFTQENPFYKYEYNFESRTGQSFALDHEKYPVKDQPIDKDIVMAFNKVGDKLVPARGDLVSIEIEGTTGCELSLGQRIQARDFVTREYNIALYMPEGTGRSAELLDELAALLRDYWFKVTKGRYQLNVYPFFVEPEEGESFESKAREMRQAFEAENSVRMNFHHYLYWQGATFYPAFGGIICGVASGNNSRTFCRSRRTMLHEQGHNFGFGHASSETLEYGDRTSIMGNNGTSPMHLPSVSLTQKGWHKERAQRELTQTEKVFLAPVATDDRNIFEGVDQNIIVKNQFIGFRGGSQDLYEIRDVRVQVHTGRSLSGRSSGSTVHANIREGATATVGGTKVHFVRVVNGMAEVDIYYNENDNAPAARQVPRQNNICLGETPAFSLLCQGDQDGLTADLEGVLVNACTADRKCEFKCNEGYKVSADQQSCVEDRNLCEGEIPMNATLCTDDDELLEENLTRVLVASCSEPRKCEYTCNEGYRLNNGSCEQVRDVEILASTSNPPRLTNLRTSFELGTDTIHWRVRHAGPNALGCLAYQAADGSRGDKNSGHCSSLDDFSEMKSNNEWFWSEQYQVWALAQNLSEPTYYIPGQYWIYFYNPDTQQRDEYIFYVTE